MCAVFFFFFGHLVLKHFCASFPCNFWLWEITWLWVYLSVLLYGCNPCCYLDLKLKQFSSWRFSTVFYCPFFLTQVGYLYVDCLMISTGFWSFTFFVLIVSQDLSLCTSFQVLITATIIQFYIWFSNLFGTSCVIIQYIFSHKCFPSTYFTSVFLSCLIRLFSSPVEFYRTL